MEEQEKTKENVFWIEVSKIKPNPLQPRREFNESGLKSLADSIREYGILQPLVVSRVEHEVSTGTDVGYELIAGERRFRAAGLLGLREVPAIIRKEEMDGMKLQLALVENIQREDLNPIERAEAYKNLVDKFEMKHADIASRVGKSREAVSNTIRLLTLPGAIRDSIAHGVISEGHARALLMLNYNLEEQERLYKEIIAKSLSVREAEKASRGVAAERIVRKDAIHDPQMQVIEEKLCNSLGTRVSIIRERGGKGRIAIEFFSEEELNGLTQKLEEKCSDGSVATETKPPEDVLESFTV
ncbi:ParB/RepB/Spo0J family partition protein [Patescibacteria group bacterium]